MTTHEQKQETKRNTTPYLSVAKLQEMLELISTRNIDEVSVSFFTDRGFSRIDGPLAVRALEFFGLIDDSGKPTALMAKLRLKGEPRKKAFEEIVRSAYKELFNTIDAPQDLPNEDLTNEFIAHYSISDRVAKSAIPVFIKLCEFAGLKPEGSVVSRKREPKPKTEKPIAKSKTETSSQKTSGNPFDTFPFGGFAATHNKDSQFNGLSLTMVADGRVVIGIPADLKNRLFDDETLNANWFVLQKAAKTFADLHIPKEKSAPEEAETK